MAANTKELYHTFMAWLEDETLGDLAHQAGRDLGGDEMSPVVRMVLTKAPEMYRLRRLELQMERRARHLEHARQARAMLEEHGFIRVAVRSVDVDCVEERYSRTFETHDEYFEWRRHMLSSPGRRLSIRLAADEIAYEQTDHVLRAHENGHPFSVRIP